MNIIFDKSLGRFVLVAMFGKQSSECDFCIRKVTQKNLGMIFKDKDGIMRTCCNSLICLLEAQGVRT